MNEKMNELFEWCFCTVTMGVKSDAELKSWYPCYSIWRSGSLNQKPRVRTMKMALKMTIDRTSAISKQTVKEVAEPLTPLERQVLVNFNATDLPKNDFAGVVATMGSSRQASCAAPTFRVSESHRQLSEVSDAREANFDRRKSDGLQSFGH